MSFKTPWPSMPGSIQVILTLKTFNQLPKQNARAQPLPPPPPTPYKGQAARIQALLTVH